MTYTTTNISLADPSPNMVRHIIDKWFGGVRAEMARQMDWKNTTLQRREEAGFFTPPQQRAILQKSDEMGWGIEPKDFFPERCASEEEVMS